MPNIEKQFSISIDLFGHSNADIYPIRTTASTAEEHVDSLVTFNSETNHYVRIRDFNKLYYNITKCKIRKFFCKQLHTTFPQSRKT